MWVQQKCLCAKKIYGFRSVRAPGAQDKQACVLTVDSMLDCCPAHFVTVAQLSRVCCVLQHDSWSTAGSEANDGDLQQHNTLRFGMQHQYKGMLDMQPRCQRLQ
eukprot:GHUV01032148.1.p2 GENE.GHUV01032148.1~~GHUV01032148.1.p2  ORF type:complete len:104 (-),score=15.86 GHUV01032148.1:181-492(-)